MKNELKLKWIEALRSGKFNQTYNRLVRGTEKEIKGYCCLGVLCEVAGGKKIFWAGYYDPDLEFHSFEFPNPDNPKVPIESGEGTLTYKALELLGLSDTEEGLLIEMNDNKTLNFEQIAQWVENNIESE